MAVAFGVPCISVMGPTSLAKTNLNHDVGYLESGLTGSPEMMVLTNEIISMTRRFVEGVRVDDEALAGEVIGALLQISSDSELIKWIAVGTVAVTSVNIFGGFAVTRRMLEMFRK